MAYGNVSQRRMVVEDLDAAIAWGSRALDLARRLDDADATVYALTNIGAAQFEAGLQEGVSTLVQALDLARNMTSKITPGGRSSTSSIARCGDGPSA